MMVSDTRESVMGVIEESDQGSADKIKELININIEWLRQQRKNY